MKGLAYVYVFFEKGYFLLAKEFTTYYINL